MLNYFQPITQENNFQQYNVGTNNVKLLNYNILYTILVIIILPFIYAELNIHIIVLQLFSGL